MWRKPAGRRKHNVQALCMHSFSVKFPRRKKSQSRFGRTHLIKEHAYKRSVHNIVFWHTSVICEFSCRIGWDRVVQSSSSLCYILVYSTQPLGFQLRLFNMQKKMAFNLHVLHSVCNIFTCISVDTCNTLHHNNFQAKEHRRTLRFVGGRHKSTQLVLG